MTADRSHGPLPVFLVCLTAVTGLVDAFSYLSMGHVFIAVEPVGDVCGIYRPSRIPMPSW
jgi:hypothetical protein